MVKLVNSSHTRLHNTPVITSALAATTTPVRWRRFADASSKNGTSKPPRTSNQKNGAVAPEVMMPSSSVAPAAPGYATVKSSQPMKNASTAMNVASSRARSANNFSPQSNTPAFFEAASTHISNARPESIADATKIGAMMAEYQPSFAISRPKIHAVTLCTKMATGSATYDNI